MVILTVEAGTPAKTKQGAGLVNLTYFTISSYIIMPGKDSRLFILKE